MIYKYKLSFFILNERVQYRKFFHFKFSYVGTIKIIPLHITNGIGAWIKKFEESKKMSLMNTLKYKGYHNIGTSKEYDEAHKRKDDGAQ